MLRAPLATSQKKTIFGRCVSSIQTTRPTHRQTVSEALVRCTKRMYRFWLCSRHFPWSFLRGILCRLSLCFSRRHTDSRRRKSPKRSCVLQLSMMRAKIFPGIFNSEMPLWLSQDALSSSFLYRWMALASLKSLGRYLIRNRCFPSLELLIFSGFSLVLGDRQESLEPGAEVYFGLLTGRSVEKLVKDFSPTFNDIRPPCKQVSGRRWDRSHEIERGAIYTVFEPSKNLLKLCSSEYCRSSVALCCHHVSFICLSSVWTLFLRCLFNWDDRAWQSRSFPKANC